MSELINFRICGLPEGAKSSVEKETLDGAVVYTVTVSGETELNYAGMSIEFEMTAGNICGRWYPYAKSYNKGVRAAWESPLTSQLTYNPPLVSYYDPCDVNRLTAALSDGFSRYDVSTGISDGTGLLSYRAKLSSVSPSAAKSYVVKLYADTSTRPYYEAVSGVSRWWNSMYGIDAAAVPQAAYHPVYSTWYAYHRGVNAETLLEECRLARSVGCKTVFIDDGWYMPEVSAEVHHYYSGDWTADKTRFPDFRAFVEEIHKLGMKLVLWAAPSLAGYGSRVAKLFDGKFLGKSDWLQYHILDPRYPEIRAHLCRSICRLASEYKIDGLKLDYIDTLSGPDCAAGGERDYTSVSEASYALLTQLTGQLREINPSLLIEYRQSYTGPNIQRLANMMRSCDCPQDGLTNRINCADLRMYCTALAVHSDMVQFPEGEAAEYSAYQLTNILFSTPQISVKLENISANQLKMLRFYINFMTGNIGLLQKSAFKPSRCDANYASITAENETEQLTALYSTPYVVLGGGKSKYTVVNACGSDEIIVGASGEAGYTVLNCMGEKTGSGVLHFAGAPLPVKVPINGMLIIKK